MTLTDRGGRHGLAEFLGADRLAQVMTSAIIWHVLCLESGHRQPLALSLGCDAYTSTAQGVCPVLAGRALADVAFLGAGGCALGKVYADRGFTR